ncbi:HAD family hydrolase [Intrasporangium sp.]|uniref:HAD family hydrolase n=1 Tax=Intrasporangium sp. TaxID=1925024 RepID=UPI00397747E4
MAPPFPEEVHAGSGGSPATLPAGVLWDMDGTLVDTEPYWILAEHELVAAHGGTWSDALAHQLVGNALEVSAQVIIDHARMPLSVPEVIDALLQRVIDQVRVRVPWRPGARELLDELKASGVPNVLVTMSWRNLADTVVEKLPPGVFVHVVTGDEVRHGKPHPEPYLRAAELIGADPAACVALEDSPTGVRSAVAAGVPTIAIPNVVAVPPDSGAVRIASLDGLRARDLRSVAAGVSPAPSQQ